MPLLCGQRPGLGVPVPVQLNSSHSADPVVEDERLDACEASLFLRWRSLARGAGSGVSSRGTSGVRSVRSFVSTGASPIGLQRPPSRRCDKSCEARGTATGLWTRAHRCKPQRLDPRHLHQRTEPRNKAAPLLLPPTTRGIPNGPPERARLSTRPSHLRGTRSSAHRRPRTKASGPSLQHSPQGLSRPWTGPCAFFCRGTRSAMTVHCGARGVMARASCASQTGHPLRPREVSPRSGALPPSCK